MPLQEKPALEDGYTDILRKAQRGLQMTSDDLAQRADLPPESLRRLTTGELDPDALTRAAFVLGLDGAALLRAAQGRWEPAPVPEIPGFAMFTTDYADMTVNAYLVWDSATGAAASFDTGATCQPILDTVNAHDLQLTRSFITHTHMDHLADLDRLLAETRATGYGSAVENPLGLSPLRPGDGLMVGGLRIRVRGTSGHTPGGLSYVVDGLARSLVVVGDALFAGSMGGAPYAYAEARRNNIEQILSLPADTVICPGHGPLTTVGEERQHNPFFPELRADAPTGGSR